MAITVVFLPLVGAFIAAASVLVAEVEERLFLIAACFCVFASAVLASILFINLQSEDYVRVIPLASWIDAGPFRAAWGLRIDSLSVLMMAMVTMVSALVHFYSLGYMEHERGRPRFFFALGLFTFSMLVLAASENLLQLFLGWEAVGLCSYLLIGFWWRKQSATAAAIKAFVVNRTGDLGMVLALCALFALFNSLDFSTLFALIPIHSEMTIGAFPAYEVVALLLFFAAMGKSAQLGLHTWLPDAMEGPTPVSALIHAATMVTAGVFLLVRMSPLFALAPFALEVVMAIGIATALFAALAAAAQNDIKRIIAWSTCSQLGYMFAAIGAAAWGAAMFHMLTHAFFKALLFLAAGAVIHAASGEQDIRKLGGLKAKMPFTRLLTLVGAASLVGVPFFAGYYSKDFILEAVAAKSLPAAAIGLLAAVATAFYCRRLVVGVFYGKPRSAASRSAREVGGVMGIPMFVLALGAIFCGRGFYELLVGDHQYSFWGDSVEMISQSLAFYGAHKTAQVIPWLALAAITIGLLLPQSAAGEARRFKKLAALLNNGFGIDDFYRRFLVVPYRILADNLWKLADEAIIQKQWVEGAAFKVRALGLAAALAHNGRLYRYASVMLLAAAVAALWVGSRYQR